MIKQQRHFIVFSIILAFQLTGFANAETLREAAERSGSIASRITNFGAISAGESRSIEWDIISYVDIDSDIQIKLPNGQYIQFTGQRISREPAAYSIGDQQSYKHSYRATVSIPADAVEGTATVGLLTYKRGDSSPKKMFALFPGNVVRRPVGDQAKGFEWDIRPFEGATLYWPIPEYNSFYSVNVGEYNSPFGYHKGLDVFTSPDARILAICDGEVVRDVTSDSDRPDVWNKLLVIKHDNCNGQNVYGYYAHIYSSVNGTVTAGQEIGTVISWPNSPSNTHIHFGLNTDLIVANWGYGNSSSVVSNERWIDPRVFFNRWE